LLGTEFARHNVFYVWPRIVRLAGLFGYPYPRPAPAAQRRDSGPASEAASFLYSARYVLTLYELYSGNPQMRWSNFSRMECARLETAALKDVTDEYYYGCSCQSCLHSARLSLSKLKIQLGDDFPLINIRGRLKCRICSSRNVTITFLGPHQKGGNLHYLFDKEPR
jgi:hypothetical protein